MNSCAFFGLYYVSGNSLETAWQAFKATKRFMLKPSSFWVSVKNHLGAKNYRQTIRGCVE